MGYSSRSSVLKQIHKEFNHKAENDKCHKRSKNKILITLTSDAYEQVLTYYRHVPSTLYSNFILQMKKTI